MRMKAVNQLQLNNWWMLLATIAQLIVAGNIAKVNLVQCETPVLIYGIEAQEARSCENPSTDRDTACTRFVTTEDA
jgi:hypothetical protein